MSINLQSVIGLIKGGSTEGERNAAREAFKRITGFDYEWKINIYDHVTDVDVDPIKQKYDQFQDDLRWYKQNSDDRSRIKEILRVRKLFVNARTMTETEYFNEGKQVKFLLNDDDNSWKLWKIDNSFFTEGKGPSALNYCIKKAYGEL